MKIKNSFLTSSIIYVFGSFLTSGLAFITTPIFTRLLTPEDYGITSVFAAWLNIFVNFIGMQTLVSIAPRYVHRNKTKFNEYISSILFLSTISFIVVLTISFIFKELLALLLNMTEFLVVVLVVQAFFSYVQQFYNTYLIQTGQATQSLIISLSYSVVTIVLSLFLIYNMNTDRYYGKILGNAIITCLLGIILFIIIMLKGKKYISKENWSYCLPLALPSVINSLSCLILNQSDRIMSQKILGDYEAGIYSFAYNIALVLLTLWNATNNAWVPWYFENTKKGNSIDINKFSKKYINIISVLCCLIMLLIPEAMKVLGPESYWSAGRLTAIIIIGIYFYYLSMFATNYELYKQNTRWIAIGTVAASIINIGLNLFLMPLIGNIGAAIATLISYFCLFIFHNILVKKFEGFNIERKNYFFGILIVVVCFVIFNITYNHVLIRGGIALILLCAIFFKNKTILLEKLKKLCK
ncbi:hypothetical protein DW091_13155 [Eubacterium sp. AM05-23]|uniref:lipopolysaccharide biosynthesis protein n=1 Tax=Eubacterium TaxID=1730 RepID=UPI000E528E2D|nr:MULTISPECIES: oligosaccharide flippase family protein [Eubacterium]RHO57297.1 hypothetical protein DW091_13155 [Eubacterium sp. AM05-23]